MDDQNKFPRDSADDRRPAASRIVTRRDFLNGVSIAVGASLAVGSPWLEAFGIPDSPFAPEKDPGYYPPSKTGMRGSHDGSFEVAHALRDGKDGRTLPPTTKTTT